MENDKRARAQAADRARRHLDHRGPGVAHAHLGVDRAVDEPQGGGGRRPWPTAPRRGRRCRDATGSRRWSPRRRARRGGRACRTPPGHGAHPSTMRPSTATSGPGANRSTSSGAPGSTPARGGDAPDARRPRRRPRRRCRPAAPPGCPTSVVGLITHGKPDRARPPRPPRRARPRRPRAAKAGWGTSTAASRVRMASLSRAAATASGGLCRSPSCADGLGGDQGAHVVDGDHGVEGGDGVVGDDDAGPPRGSSRGTSSDREPMTAVQGVGLLGADHDVDAEGPGRIEEVPGPVRRRRDEEE